MPEDVKERILEHIAVSFLKESRPPTARAGPRKFQSCGFRSRRLCVDVCA